MSDPIKTAEQAHREMHPRHGSSNWVDHLVYGLCGIAVSAVVCLVVLGYIGGA